MWPWGHLALGYVLYSLGTRAGTRRGPDAWNVLALALGTQGPDLVDKPLAWWVSVLPGGRTLGHSLLFAGPLLVVLAVLAWRVGGLDRVAAFAVGWVSHLAGDAVEPFLVGSYGELAFLLWPAMPTVVYDVEPSVLWHLSQISLDSVVLAELALVAVVVALWVVDGLPGLRGLRGPRPPRGHDAAE